MEKSKINVWDYEIQVHWFDADLLSKKLDIDFLTTEKKRGRNAVEIMTLYIEVRKQPDEPIYQKVLKQLFICEAAFEKIILNKSKKEKMKEEVSIDAVETIEPTPTIEVVSEDLETQKIDEPIEKEPLALLPPIEPTNYITRICVWLSNFLKDANILILPMLVLVGFQSFHLATVVERISEHSVWVAWLCAVPIELLAIFAALHATKKSYGLIDSIERFAWAQFIITLFYCEFWKVDQFQDIDSIFTLIQRVSFGAVFAYSLYIYSEIFVETSKENK